MEGKYMMFTFIRASSYDTLFERGPVSIRWNFPFPFCPPFELVDCRAPIYQPFTSVPPRRTACFSCSVILKWDIYVSVNTRASYEHVRKLKWEILSASVGLHWENWWYRVQHCGTGMWAVGRGENERRNGLYFPPTKKNSQWSYHIQLSSN